MSPTEVGTTSAPSYTTSTDSTRVTSRSVV
jgi:hypothetical protein